MTIAGLILAGGRGERMGGADKAALVVGGLRLIDRVAGVLAACRPLLLSLGVDRDTPAYGIDGLQAVADLRSGYAGPLAGVAAAADWLTQFANPPEFLVVAAVDAPFLPVDYVARLAAGIGSAPCAISIYGGQIYPTNSIWRMEALRSLPDALRNGAAPHSLKRLSAELGGAMVAWPVTEAGDPFANANTPEELDLLRRRADRMVQR